jgi:hypothetical protein
MMKRPVNMYRKGGLKDEGGEIDPVSGNKVPVGGTKKGVRDDIPVNLSEGEFVMPEDATRYHGLKTMMKLRQEAKMGLKQMEAMGLMGNADEATLPDDLPFGLDDLIIVDVPDDDTKNMAVGGVTTSDATGVTGGGVRVERPATPVTRPDTSIVDPDGGRTQFRQLTTSPIPTRLTIPEFKAYMGEAYLEFKEYRNAEGKSMLIPFIGGKPLYPIPDGYTLYDEDAIPDEEGVEDTTVDDLTETSQASNNDDDGPTFAPAPDPIDWGSLSDEELLAEAGKRMGFGRTLAEGIAMGINPILGLVTKGLMIAEDRKVLEELQRRAAAGSTMFDDMIKTYQDKNKGLLNTAIGKVVDLVNNTFGKSEQEVKETAELLVNENIPVTTEKNEQGVYDSQVVQTLTGQTQAAYEEAAGITPMSEADKEEIVMSQPVVPTGVTDEEVVMSQPVAPAQTPEEVVMSQPVTPAQTPEEVVMSQPVTPAVSDEEVVMSQPVTPATGPSEFVQSRTNYQEFGDPLGSGTIISTSPMSTVAAQTDDAFQVSPLVEEVVQATTGTQYVPATPDPTNYAVTPAQVSYSTSVSQGQEDPYDPRGILPTSEQVTVPKPVTTPIQTTVTQPTVPEVDTAPNIPTATVDTSPSVPAQIPPLSPETPTGITPSVPAVDTSTPSDQTAEMFREQEQQIAAQQGAGSTVTEADKEEIVMSQPVAPAQTPTVTTVVPSQDVQDAVTPADITYDEFGDVIETAPASTVTTPAAEQTFSEAFAEARAAGKDTFTFDGKSFTTETKEEKAAKEEEARPAASTSTATRADTTASGATILPTGTTIATGTVLNKADDPVVIVDGKAYNESNAPASATSTTDDSPAPSTSSSSRDTNVASSGRTETEIQADINAAIKEAGEGNWTSELNDLVAERDSARANEGSSTPAPASSNNDSGGNDDGGGGGGGGNDKILCDLIYRYGYLDKKIWELDEAFGDYVKQTDPELLEGYHIWAKPMVKWIEKESYLSKLYLKYWCVPFTRRWANHIAHVMEPETYKPDYVGKLMLTVGVPISRAIYKIKNMGKSKNTRQFAK